jgi:hypothetical protein
MRMSDLEPKVRLVEAREQKLRVLPNDALLADLDRVLVELERRLFTYAHTEGQFQAMSDEGLVLAARSAARLGQSQSAAAHAKSHLQISGVGNWRPGSTRPGWNDDARTQSGD